MLEFYQVAYCFIHRRLASSQSAAIRAFQIQYFIKFMGGFLIAMKYALTFTIQFVLGGDLSWTIRSHSQWVCTWSSWCMSCQVYSQWHRADNGESLFQWWFAGSHCRFYNPCWPTLHSVKLYHIWLWHCCMPSLQPMPQSWQCRVLVPVAQNGKE